MCARMGLNTYPRQGTIDQAIMRHRFPFPWMNPGRIVLQGTETFYHRC
jgi:hypothetical protein